MSYILAFLFGTFIAACCMTLTNFVFPVFTPQGFCFTPVFGVLSASLVYLASNWRKHA
jgi:hypothetical protein